MKALLLAAGLGTRLKPFTDKHPKALASVNGKSLLEWNIRRLQEFGINSVVVNVHHFADQIEQALADSNGFGSHYEISDERKEVLETGGGLLHAANFFPADQDFLVMNVDILSNIDLHRLLQHHQKYQALATLAVQQRTSSRYFLFDEALQLRGWEHVQTGEIKIPKATQAPELLQRRAFSGIQVLNHRIFNKISLQGKFSLVDAYLSLCATECINGWDHTDDLLLDVGKPESLQRAAELFH